MTKQPAKPEDVYVCDTMALVLWLEQRKLPQAINYIFTEVIHGRAGMFVPAMALAEVGYLAEKKRIALSLPDVALWIEKLPSVQVAPVSSAVTTRAFLITDIPELHDRLIAATAAELNAPLLTNDPKIKASKFVKTLWSIPRHANQKVRRLSESRAISPL